MRTSSRYSALFDAKSGLEAAWAAVWQLVPDTSCFCATTGRAGVPASAKTAAPYPRETIAMAAWAERNRRDIAVTPHLAARSVCVPVAPADRLYLQGRVSDAWEPAFDPRGQ